MSARRPKMDTSRTAKANRRGDGTPSLVGLLLATPMRMTKTSSLGAPAGIQVARLLVLLAGLLGDMGCVSRSCKGFTTCSDFEPARCGGVAGCSATPGCVAPALNPTGCSSTVDQGICRANPVCRWSGGVCVDGCTLFVDQSSCESTNDYGGCRWSSCTGTPVRQCQLYPADECPTTPLGCYVEDNN
jgi:hypothetical protein